MPGFKYSKIKKYILHPGRRLRDNKPISAQLLAQLYGIDETECVTRSYVVAHPGATFRGYKHLYIRDDDNYTL